MTDLEKARQKIEETDRAIALLFQERMAAVRLVAEYKKTHGLPITDSSREEQLIKANLSLIEDPVLLEYYTAFLKNTIEISKQFQLEIIDK